MSDPALTLWCEFARKKTLVSTIGPTFGIVRADATGTVFNSEGLIETVVANIARFDFNPANRASLGILVEEARIELCFHNRDFTNVVWVKSTMTAAKDQVGEDGITNSASSLLATGANATALQTFTIVSAVKVAHFSLKRITGSGDIQITIDNGVTWTTQTINSSTWTRVNVSQTLANPVIGIRLVTDTDKIAVDFAGLNDGASFPTSQIETTTASVTRNADVVSTSDVSWYTEATGTLYLEGRANSGVDGVLLQLSDGSNNNRIQLAKTSNDNSEARYVSGSGTVAVPVITNSWDTAGAHRTVTAYAANDFHLFTDGTAATPDTDGAVPVSIDLFRVGTTHDSARVFNGHIAEIRYYNVRKDNQFLEDLSNGLISEDDLNFSRNLARPLERTLATTMR